MNSVMAHVCNFTFLPPPPFPPPPPPHTHQKTKKILDLDSL